MPDKKTESIFLEIRKDDYEGALFLNGLIGGAFSGSFSSADDTSKINLLAKEIGPLADTLKIHEKPAVLNVVLRDKNHVLKEMLRSGLPCTVRILNETAMDIKVPGYTNELPYAAVGGVLESIWPKANGLNLLERGVHKKPKPPLVLTVLLAVSIVVMWILYLIAPLKIEQKRLEAIDHQIDIRRDEIKKIEALKKEIEGIQADISTINDFKHGRPMALNILKELTTILPKTTWLSRLRITETTVEIEGYAGSASGLLSKLEASSYFKKAEFASPTFRDVRMNADRFNIKMEIEGFSKENQEKKAGSTRMTKSRTLVIAIPMMVVLAGILLYQYVYLGIQSEVSSIKESQSMKTRTLEKYMAFIAEKPDLEKELASLKEERKAEDSKLIEGQTISLAAASLQDIVKDTVTRSGGSISSERIVKPEDSVNLKRSVSVSTQSCLIHGYCGMCFIPLRRAPLIWP